MKKTFREKVYEYTRKIPRGKVATYGQLARLVGVPKAARAVGMCMRTNPDAPNTPCHRVVSANGSLTGYSAAGGLTQKRKMLIREGVVMVGERADLSKSQWKK
jgi:O-6-methylguanine DNA methyltransferase